MTFVRFLLFVAVWTGLDFFSKHVSAQGLATPWYPQAALALALILLTGWRNIIWIPAARLISSVNNWPGSVAERIVPALTFTVAIAAIAEFVRSRLAQEKKTPMQLFGEISAGVALISLAQSVARVGYYTWLEGGSDVGFAGAMLTNWVGDISSLFTITPALVLFSNLLLYDRVENKPWFSNTLISPYLPNTEQMLNTIRGSAPFAFLIVGFAGFLCLMPPEWNFRAWYLVVFPCFAMAIFYGMTGAILAVTSVEICLGILATAYLPGQNIVEVQIFFLCLAFLVFSLGILSSERERQIERLTVGARLIIGAQLIKIRTLTELGERLTAPLAALKKTIDQGAMAGIAAPAEVFLAKFDAFLEDAQNFDPLANTLTPISGDRLRENLAAHFPDLEINLSGSGKSIGDEKLISEVAHLMAQIAMQQKFKHSRKPTLEVSIEDTLIELSSTVRLSGGDFAVGDLDFVSLLRPPTWSLPPAGHPLTFYRIHSLVQLAGGRFWLRPVFFSLSDQWVMRARIPLHGALL